MSSEHYPIWHPFTQMKTAGAPLPVKSAKNEFVQLADGRTLIDCISSWWVTLHGHSNKTIADAIHAQAQQLEHVIFAGFTHDPALNLARRIMTKLPSELTRVFFSDNGSTSVEVALKMAVQYWHNLGQSERTMFIGFADGYHGDTLGAMSAGGSSPFWDPFRAMMFPIETAPYPFTHDGDQEVEQKEADALSALRSILERKGSRCAGIIVEPLVQGAAGMHMCRPEFMRALRKVADEFGVLLIFDEVMTGFGRTGDWFACSKINAASPEPNIHPDIICLSKGITGGVLPLSVTFCTEQIYQAFLSDELGKALFHSHSYTGNPIACAAGVASWDLLINNEHLFKGMEQRHRKFAERILFNNANLHNYRFCGTIAAFDINLGDKQNYFSGFVPKLRQRFVDCGLLLRPLGDTVYFMPPLCVSDESMERMYTTANDVINEFVHNYAVATV